MMAKWMWLTVEEFARLVHENPRATRGAIARREKLELGIHTNDFTLYAIRGEDGEHRIPIAVVNSARALVFTTRTSYERYLQTGNELYGIPLPCRAVKRLCWGDIE